jgi:hypothetical protein
MRGIRQPILLLLLLLCLLAGCRESAQPTATADPGLQIDLLLPNLSPGQTNVTITLSTADATPIDDATIKLTGDMNHAGMKPEFGEITGGKAGRYEVPFNWSMGGSWVLTVEVSLPDGRTGKRIFNINVGN